MTLKYLSTILTLAILLPGFSLAQPAPSRAATIEQARDKQVSSPPSAAKDPFEAAMDRIESNTLYRWITQPPAGLGLRFGGLETGSGFGLGPQFSRPDLFRENLKIRVGLAASLRRYYTADALLSLPRLFDRRLQLDAYLSRSDAPQVPYYGSGNDSRKQQRTNFRRETNLVDFRGGWRIDRRHLLLGATFGQKWFNISPGESDRFASSDTVFTPAQSPGIDRQTSFFHYGPFFQADYRDRPGDPHRGTNFVARYNFYDDQRLKLHSFRRLESVVEHYIPFFNDKRVFALRGRADFSFTQPGQTVPFYLQTTLGGSDDLRGFRNFRFYGNNMVVFNAEYRYEVAPALDMALFFDSGKVFSEPGTFQISRMKNSGGIGFRFKTRDSIALRLDAAASREGFQIWFKFNSPFQGLFHNIF